jgi:hypothetical protein
MNHPISLIAAIFAASAIQINGVPVALPVHKITPTRVRMDLTDGQVWITADDQQIDLGADADGHALFEDIRGITYGIEFSKQAPLTIQDIPEQVVAHA